MQTSAHSNSQRWPRTKTILLVLAGVVVLGLVGFAAMRLIPSDQGVCNDRLIKKATPLLAPDKLNELQPVAEEILAKPDYATDVNCVYIVTNYSINLSNIESLQQHYDQLVKVYKPADGYSKEFGDNTLTPENVKQVLDFLKTTKPEMENNRLQGPAV